MTAPMRRGDCPALTRPMQTGDGLIARLKPAAGLSPDQLAALCDASGAFGNGLLEVTQRGSLQFRGLTAETAPLIADTVNRLGIPAQSGLTVDIGPLAGLDPAATADPRPIADRLRAAIAARSLAAQLGPKVSVTVDGGGAIGLGSVQGDVRLQAISAGRWQVAVGGTADTATCVGVLSDVDAVAATLALLEAVAAKGRTGRARDLTAEQVASAVAGLRVEPLPKPPVAATPVIGAHPLSDGRIAVVVGVAFGLAGAPQLKELARLAPTGFAEFRFAPERAIVMIVPGHAASTVALAADRLGFVTRSGDPRLSVVACAGRPACGSAGFATRAVASDVAEAAAGMLDGSVRIHLSGCAKGCAHPEPAALTFAGVADRVDLVVAGTASGRASAHLQAEEILSTVGRVAGYVARNRIEGETSRAVIERLGKSGSISMDEGRPT